MINAVNNSDLVIIALIGIGAAMLLLAPRGFPFRWLAVPLLLTTWLPRTPVLDVGEFNVHVLDVDQIEVDGKAMPISLA